MKQLRVRCRVQSTAQGTAHSKREEREAGLLPVLVGCPSSNLFKVPRRSSRGSALEAHTKRRFAVGRRTDFGFHRRCGGHFTSVSRVTFIAVLVLAACGETVEPYQRQRAAIFGGQPAPDDVSVFFIDNDAGVCSATLIAPRTLLTAAHCVQDAVPMFALNHERVDVPGDGGMFTVVKRVTYAQATDGGTADLALLLLDRPPPITPKPWAWWGPPPPQNSAVRHVGYGRTERTPAGTRNSVSTMTRGTVENRSWGMVLTSGDFGKGLCFGDSGGPVLGPTSTGERLIAVNSFIDTACGEGVSSSVMVFPYRRFIQSWLAANEPADCARDGRCVGACTPEDPDCRCGSDGVCRADCAENDDPDCPGECRVDGMCSPRAVCPSGDGDCILDGDACLSPEQCGGRQCVNDPQNTQRYCSLRCGTLQPCPETMSCESTRGVCVLKQLPLVAERAVCGPLLKCAVGTACTDVGTERRCLRTCSSQANCLEGTRCRFGTVNVCMPMPSIALDAGTQWEGPLAPNGCSSAPGPFVAAALVGLRRARRPGTRKLSMLRCRDDTSE
jgi:hypothetical protein